MAESAAGERPVAVFDLDGTLALIEHRLHFIERKPKDWNAFFAACADDAPNVPLVRVAEALAAHGMEIWVATGRSDAVRAKTRAWFTQHEVPCDRLMMRAAHDRRADWVLKRSWLTSGQIPVARVQMVFEDRARVVQMWREAGLTCLQVADSA